MANESKGWALILGASSGFGAASALELAKNGFDIFGVHFDLRRTIANAELVCADIEAQGREALFFNINAADEEKRNQVLDQIDQKCFGTDRFVHVVLHSLAFGTLRPFFGDGEKNSMNQKSLEMTLDVMANSLMYWVQGLRNRKLLTRGSQVFAMTSSGSTRVIRSYGAVSAAKSSLESHIRQIAFELAPEGITANAIQAGVTDTPALRMIPEGPGFLERASASNPSGRATTPADIAKAIAGFATRAENFAWMTGNVIRVDGGEDITA